jgi:Uma2 family endonuclease
MSTAVRLARGADQPLALPMYRLTVEQYHRMIDSAILTKYDRVELLEGWMVAKMTHNPPHDVTISLLQGEFATRVSATWLVRVQSAITTNDSEPEPDVAVVRGPARRYARAHPGPRDIGLLVEVAETSLIADRILKAQIYARARIPVYWIVNLPESKIEVYTQPRSGKSPGYRQRTDYARNQDVPLVLDGHEIGKIPVRDLLP